MKRIKFLLFYLGLVISFNSFGQVQKHVWYLDQTEVDFSSGSPSVSTGFNYGAAPGGGGSHTGNGIHNENGERILSVWAGNVYTQDGFLDNLAVWESFDAEPAHIIPKPGGSACEYYIIYTTIAAHEIVPPLTCNIQGYYNTFYSEVDLSANFGAGSMVSNGIPLNTCTYYDQSASVTISPEINPNGDRFMYLFGANKITDEEEILKYIITSSGISYVNTVYSGFLPVGFGTVEFELSHDRTKLSIANYLGNEVFVFHLDPSTGNLVPNAGNNGDGTSDYNIPSSSNKLTGLEFSSNGDYLYVASKFDGIFQIDLVSDVVSTLPLSGSLAYGNSELELAYEPTGDYNIYAVSNTGTELGSINFSNTSMPIFDPGVITGISAFSEPFSSVWAGTDGVWVLPSQIDGENYTARFANISGECCASLEGFDTYSYAATLANETWEPGSNPFGGLSLVRVAEEIRIPSGKTVYMTNMEFHFNENAKLIVEPGARLILTNTTLTSVDCEGLLWLGVELQGNASLDQSPNSQQGFLLIQSNSEISNAHNGISVYGRDANDNIDWSKTGGIVRAYNSVFRNNIRDVEYLAYFHKNTGIFRNCEFITDNEINNGSTPYAHVTMYHVENIGFYGCDFKNTTVGLYPDNDRGHGIISIDAKYKVSYFCTAILPVSTPCPDSDKDGNVFENLFFGIKATASNPFYTVDIRYNEFNNNTRGIYLGGVDYAICVENDINVGTPNPYTYGLYLNNCTGYQVENNDFYSALTDGTYGAIITNSNDNGNNPDANEIYHNNFDGFEYAATAVGTNVQMVGGNPVTNTGLTFKCNNFNNSTRFDILVLSGGVSPFQGACTVASPGQPHAQANNVFSPTPSAFGDLWNANSTIFQIDYRFEDGTPSYQTEPRIGLYNPNNTTISNCGTYDPLVSCPENKWDITKAVLISKISEYKMTADELLYKIDGGDKEGLLSSINSNMSPGQLKNLLLESSPYLSDEVLIATINRTPQLPHGVLKEIILANSPVSLEVLSELENLNLPNGIVNQINDAQVGISARTDLESEASYWYIETDLSQHELIRRYLHDTTIIDGEDSIVFILKNSHKPIHDKCHLSALYIKKGEYTEAQSEIDELRSMSCCDVSDYCDYLELLIELEQTIKKCYSLQDDPSRKDAMEAIADKNDGSKECYHATALLKQILAYPFEEYVPEYTPPHTPIYYDETRTNVIDRNIYIYPNPAKDYITVELMLEDNADAVVYVYDLTGKLVLNEKITNTQSYVDISSLNNGTYVLNIHLQDGNLIIRKITVNK